MWAVRLDCPVASARGCSVDIGQQAARREAGQGSYSTRAGAPGGPSSGSLHPTSPVFHNFFLTSTRFKAVPHVSHCAKCASIERIEMTKLHESGNTAHMEHSLSPW